MKLKRLLTEAVKNDMVNLMGQSFVSEWENTSKTFVDFASGKYNGNIFSDTFRMLIYKCGHAMSLKSFDGNPKRLLKTFNDVESQIVDMSFETAKLFDFDFITEKKKSVDDAFASARKLINDFIEKQQN